MTTREKIILGIAGAGVIWAGVSLVRTPSRAVAGKAVAAGGDGETPAAALRQVERSRGEIAAGRLSPAERYTLAASLEPWTLHPFPEQSQGVRSGGGAPAFLYSGFVRVGDSVFAIVNGREYRVGDALAGTDAEIESIEPTHVGLLYRRSNRRQTVPFQPVPGGVKL